MATKPISDELLQVSLDAFHRNGKNTTFAARELGIPRNTLDSRLKTARARGMMQSVDSNIPTGHILKGKSTLYDHEGNERLTWVKTNLDAEAAKKALLVLSESLCKKLPSVDRIKPPKKFDENLMMVIPFGDPHIGLYCSREEVGESFNLDIATKDLCGAFDYLISSGVPTGHCVILNLGDFFHASNYEGMTKRSKHVLDMAGRFPEIIDAGVQALRFCVERAAEKHGTVSLVNSIGNHDDEMAVCLSIMFRNIYRDNPRIKVYEAAKTRHYIQHGKVLVGVTHGHQTKDQALPLLMASEKSKEWGETKHRYFYRGHHHHQELMEYNGCVVEQFRTLAPSDSYAHSHGYLSGRDMKSIIHHSEYGEVSRTVCSVDMLRKIS